MNYKVPKLAVYSFNGGNQDHRGAIQELANYTNFSGAGSGVEQNKHNLSGMLIAKIDSNKDLKQFKNAYGMHGNQDILTFKKF